MSAIVYFLVDKFNHSRQNTFLAIHSPGFSFLHIQCEYDVARWPFIHMQLKDKYMIPCSGLGLMIFLKEELYWNYLVKNTFKLYSLHRITLLPKLEWAVNLPVIWPNNLPFINRSASRALWCACASPNCTVHYSYYFRTKQ